MLANRSTTFKSILKPISLAVCLLSAGAANASNMEYLLDRLYKKGVLTEREYQEMRDMAREESTATDATATTATKAAKESAQAAKSNVVARYKNGLTIESADGQHAIGLTGRVHYDYRNNSNSFAQNFDRDTSSLADSFELRRARIGLKGFVFKDISYEIVGNLVGSDTNTVDTAWINFGHFKPAQVRFGRSKQPFNLEELTSSNNIDFIERSYVNQLSPGKKHSIVLHGDPIKGVSYGVSMFQESFSEATNETGDGKQYAARIAVDVAQLAGMTDAVLHLGAAATTGKYNLTPATSSQTSSAASSTQTRGTIVGFRTDARGLTNTYRAQLAGDALGTAAYSGLSNTAAEVDRELRGLEFAGAYGPFKLQSEWATSELDARHRNTASFVTGEVKASYAEFIWNITGESWAAAYKSGAFGGITPKSNFVLNGGTGAWQAGMRLSKYDASDIRVGNGTAAAGTAREQNSDKAQTLTVGVNWILNPNARVLFNYARTKFNTPVTPIDVALLPGQTNVGTDEKIFSIRTQLAF